MRRINMEMRLCYSEKLYNDLILGGNIENLRKKIDWYAHSISRYFFTSFNLLTAKPLLFAPAFGLSFHQSCFDLKELWSRFPCIFLTNISSWRCYYKFQSYNRAIVFVVFLTSTVFLARHCFIGFGLNLINFSKSTSISYQLDKSVME